MSIDPRELYISTSAHREKLFLLSACTPPGDSKITAEKYNLILVSPYNRVGEVYFDQIAQVARLSTIVDKWFFFRGHPWHFINHKRRKVGVEKENYLLTKLCWKNYKIRLHKKHYHLYDKTKRGKTERAELRVAKLRSDQSLHFS